MSWITYDEEVRREEERMKIKKLILLIGVAVLSVSFLGGLKRAIATDAAEGQGQVTVEGGITFYEESTEPISSSTTESSTIDSTLPSDGGGKLPQTGETIRNYSLIGGGFLLLILLILLYRRKKDKNEEGHS